MLATGWTQDLEPLGGGLYLLDDVSIPMMPSQLAQLHDPGFLPFHVHADAGFADAGAGDELRL